MRRLILCSIVLLCSGCGILSKPETRQMTRYQLATVAVTPGTSAAMPATAPVACDRVLRVQDVEAAPPYASDSLLYSETPQVISSFAWHRWATQPATMLTSDLLAAVSGANLYRSVLGPTDPGQADLLLAVRVNEGPIQVFSRGNGGDKKSVERLSLTATLTNANNGAVLGTRVFSASRKAAPNPYGGVEAANAMVRQMNSDVLAWLASLSRGDVCK
jgi:ABC-type uncharacterized transport system auxiliary subunit